MTKGVYVIEFQWVWDNVNIEYATITIEEPDHGFEELLDQDLPPLRKELLLSDIKKTADGLDKSVMSKGTLKCLYKIEWKNPDQKWVKRVTNDKTGAVTLTMRMIPICRFDGKGNPIPIKKDLKSPRQ